MADMTERFTGIIEEVVGGYHPLPLSQATVRHYQGVAENAFEGAPSEALVDPVVRAAVDLELREMQRLDRLATRIIEAGRNRNENLTT